MTQVWRLNIKTAARQGHDPRSLCFANGVLGVGWQVAGHASSWEDYLDRVSIGGHKCPAAVRALQGRMQRDDLVWSRTTTGEYWLARVTGDWEYRADDAHVAADVVNVRACVWVNVGNESTVPGNVAASFASRRTLQRVGGDTIRALSQSVYNQLTLDEHRYVISRGRRDLFAAMLPEDCEDLVGLYLQATQNYSVIPSTCRRDTPGYEFVLVSRLDGHDAVLQVKNGNVDLDSQRYRTAAQRVFLFTSRGSYTGSTPPNVVCLSPASILDFAQANPTLLPPRLRHLLSLCAEEQKEPETAGSRSQAAP